MHFIIFLAVEGDDLCPMLQAPRNAFANHSGLKTEVAQSRMPIGTATRRPMILALRFLDRKVVDGGKPCGHEPVVIKLPVLIAIGAIPVTRVVVPLVSKAYCDAVPSERPQLLDEPVVQFLGPLARQESNDFVSSVDELRAVP